MPGAKRCDLEGVPVFVVSSRPAPPRPEEESGKEEREGEREKKER